MADGVKPSEWITVQQALHGYSDGHRQIAASVPLAPDDFKAMLVLSDLSGPGSHVDQRGYLTGYPLTERGAFALARTWPAKEMPRPGCVWTHSILIDFADLANLESLDSLLPLFRRPHGLNFVAYDKPLAFRPEPSAQARTALDSEWSRLVLSGLYGEPSRPIIATRPATIDVDQVILALWSQQWPRLRRTFRFCTLTATDRSIGRSRFDLQLVPKERDRNIRGRFVHAVDIGTEESQSDSWLIDAFNDLADPDVYGLRSFLRRLGGDSGMGRRAFRPLCRLHRMIQELKSHPAVLADAIAIVEGELGPAKVHDVRAVLAHSALSQAGSLNDACLEFLLRHLEFLERHDLERVAGTLGRAVWSKGPNRLMSLMETNRAFRVIAERTFEVLPTRELARGLQEAPDLARIALTCRPDLIAEPGFWTRDFPVQADALDELANSNKTRPIVAALVAAQRDDLASTVVERCGSFVVLDILGSEMERDSKNRSFERWILAASRNPVAVSEYLAAGPTKPRILLAALARSLAPDVVPNEIGTDPWLSATRNSTGSLSEPSAIHLSAYLLSRALGPNSRSAGELAELGFEPVHDAAASSRLSDEAWLLLEERLPSSVLGGEWDRCRRIRAGVVGAFINRNLSPRVFTRIATSDHLFEDLVGIAAANSRGRRYLRRVRRAMKKEARDQFSARIWLIEKSLEKEFEL